MRGIIAGWLSGRSQAPTAMSPPTFSGPVLPESDAPDSILSDDLDPAPASVGFDPLEGRAFIICYVDAKAAASERRIVADVCYEAAGIAYVKALCLERSAKRVFRVDRIQGVFCGVTGEDLGAPARVFVPTERRAQFGSKPKAAALYPEMRKLLGLLITLARADGVVHPNERVMLRGFLEQSLPEDIPTSHIDDLVEWAWRLAPSFERFHDGAGFVFKDRPEWALTLLEAANDMVSADGRVTADESAWIDDLALIARAYGIS